MAAGLYNFIIEQGATLEKTIQYTDSEGNPVDLTGYSARMQFRDAPKGTTLYASLSTSLTADGSGITFTPEIEDVVQPITSGSIGIVMSAASSSLLSFDQAYYDLELVTNEGGVEVVQRLLQGKVKLSKEVTY